MVQDKGDITIEAIINGPKDSYDCPIKLSLYGPVNLGARTLLERSLKNDKLLTATEIKQSNKANKRREELEKAALGLRAGRSTVGFAVDSQAAEPEISMEDLLQTSQAVNLRSGEDMAKTLAMSEEMLASLPMADQPKALRSQLLPYQLQGLAWLTEKEKPTFPPPGSPNAAQLWKRDQQGRYVNIATNYTVKSAPKLLSGGILADDMGLGKTLQIISLVLTGGPGPTLVVAPLTVMSNWEQQVERHVHPEHAPQVLIYHGAQRKATAAQLKNSGIVVTSYGTLTTEHKSGRGLLCSIPWRRVVLDEGHIIRNARTKAAEAVCSLKAESRWVLSGTPM